VKYLRPYDSLPLSSRQVVQTSSRLRRTLSVRRYRLLLVVVTQAEKQKKHEQG